MGYGLFLGEPELSARERNTGEEQDQEIGEGIMKNIYKIRTSPKACRENQIQGEKYRITVLTDGLARLEYSEDGVFEDRPTQMALNRDFPPASFRVLHTMDGIEIHTGRFHLVYNEREFSQNGLWIQVKGNVTTHHSIWHYGEEIGDLGGTARTLDEADGAVELDHGVVSRFGYSLLDDSRSQIILEDGWISPRKEGIKDLYFFGYGHDYKDALKAFYHLCGKTPMLPRYALGNWWSRYYAYTEKTYINLMDRFEAEGIPFTVAVIDMDWHLVDIDEKYGSGWTGYTWNREYFPDPAGFLEELHSRGMHVTLNVHPASGVRGHEEMYVAMAKAMGVDYEHEDPVSFDVADPRFMELYFTYLHHPREEEGVDFWWIDRQQGTSSKAKGLDPLWILNHFHFLDNGRDGKRPMTFSRYAGPGSHRYPVGFSGDTIITWESLDFQPYFTAAASNIGYGWWSHDIGGHMMGYKNDELAVRWFQLGIHSPIMRLHSTSSQFNGKEPWRFKGEARKAMELALRQRHRMIPYLYSMNYRSYEDDVPLVEPMYYEHPEDKEAYEMKNQYYLGSSLMAAPITGPGNRQLNMAGVLVWLPQGLWYDIYTGMIYDGGRCLKMYRDINSIPVLAKAGGIIPFTEEISAKEAAGNPSSFTVCVYAGADGEFTLYEDDNEGCGYEEGICVKTVMTYRENLEGPKPEAVFVIEPAAGDLSLIPKKRKFTVELTGFLPEAAGKAGIYVDGQEMEREHVVISYKSRKQAVAMCLDAVEAGQRIEIKVPTGLRVKTNAVSERVFAFLNQAEIEFKVKDAVYDLVMREKRVPVLLGQLAGIGTEQELYQVLTELLTAYQG